MMILMMMIGIKLVQGGPAGPVQLSDEVINDIFNTGGGLGNRINDQGYSGEQATGDANIDLLVQIVTGTGASDNQLPADYVGTQTAKQVEVEVDQTDKECKDYTKSEGYECVPYYLCANGTIITDGAGLIDIRNGFGALDAADSKCPGFLDVCCKDADFVEPPKPQPYTPKCGRRNLKGLGARIQGFKDGESQMFEWPHMCAVLKDEDINGEIVKLFQCGGSLIAPDTILTAAHCVDKIRSEVGQMWVRCGEWDTQSTSEPYPHQDRRVGILKVHPEFNKRNLANDMALLFTTTEFQLDQHIDTVCLPEPGEQFVNMKECFATGWGKDKFGAEGNYQVVLKEIGLPIVGHDDCEKTMKSSRLGPRFRLDKSFLCAGGEPGKDTCKGDGGSPLVCPSKTTPNTWVQAGVVAWGIGCGEEQIPGVYADVGFGLCWVDHVMTCNKGGDYNSYWGKGEDCAQWSQETRERLANSVSNSRGKKRTILEDVLDQYIGCDVIYEGQDFNVFARVKSTTSTTTRKPSGGAINFGK